MHLIPAYGLLFFNPFSGMAEIKRNNVLYYLWIIIDKFTYTINLRTL
jgi:hypothetical protein